MIIKRFFQLNESVIREDKLSKIVDRYDELLEYTIEYLKIYEEIEDIVKITDFWDGNMIAYTDSIENEEEFEISKNRMIEYKKHLKENGINNYIKIISDRNDTFVWITEYLKFNNLCKDSEYVDFYTYTETGNDALEIGITDNDVFNLSRDYTFDKDEYQSLIYFINNIESYDSTKKFNI